MEPIVLASASPRRAELLRQIRVPFIVVRPEIEEKSDHDEPEAHARRVATDKAHAVYERLISQTAFARGDAATDEALVVSRILSASTLRVLAADTLIDLDGEILGKPNGSFEARAMIERLTGRTHRVISGVALLSSSAGIGSFGVPDEQVTTVATSVTFAPLSHDEIDRYIDTRDWEDAAGAYRIQSVGATLVESITGSYTNVVGLPLRRVYGMLHRTGYYQR